MGSGKQRWKFFFHRSPPATITQPPSEFLCSISGSLMADPVIVSSGHTFEFNCVQACISLHFTPTLSDGSTPNFSSVIPNIALKSAILNWCHSFLAPLPQSLNFPSAEKLVRTLMASQNPESQLKNLFPKLNSESEESATTISTGPTSSSDFDTLNLNSSESDEIVTKLRSNQVYEQEEAVISLRSITKIGEDSRIYLCTPRLLSTLRSMITSKYPLIQVNAVAALVNLSLEDQNKVKIVRCGIVPPLIDVLKGGFPEAQDHAAGVLFSLAVEDQNKTALGVLGALPPLLHALQSESDRARNDSALALYHLSLDRSNRSKLIEMGAVPTLLGMMDSGHVSGRVLLVLCNLAGCVEGRAAMLDAGAVECFVGMLREDRLESGSTRESCVTALFGLSFGELRFKCLAKHAGVVEVLKKFENIGNERSKENTRRILEIMTRKDENEETLD